MRARRIACGTQPPAATEDATEASGTIEVTPGPTEREQAIVHVAADQEPSVIVQIDDDWLARLELPAD